jgi:hypothetical protein
VRLLFDVKRTDGINTITEISRLDIGFENLIEKSITERQARSGDPIPNSHERYISFNFVNICIKTISLMLAGKTY